MVDETTIWVQPPGTPAVGEAFVCLYEATGEPLFAEAARAAAEALRRGQMRSGGWQASIEFAEKRRAKWAYRVDPVRPGQKDQSSLDDDKTQSAIRFLVHLDQALEQRDPAVHDTAIYALAGLLSKGQFSNGGFPQVWTGEPGDVGRRDARAGYPESWEREYPGHREYWSRATLNDNLMADVIDTLFLAEDVYGDERYRRAAMRAADFLIRAQMPDPQPAWAQQYDDAMHPMWARKFEPPAVTGGESQGVIATLLKVYRRAGQKKYLEPIPRALAYLEASMLPDGSLARFYELRTNRPLFFTRDYRLTHDDRDLPTHYAFTVPSRLRELRAEYETLERSAKAPAVDGSSRRKPRSAGERAVRQIIESLDERGAWVTAEGLRYHKQPGPVVDMQVTVNNLMTLAGYLARLRDEGGKPAPR